jgi:GGDEF domain-containing protein
MAFMQKMSGSSTPPLYNPDLCLTMLIEGATLGVPEVDAQAYRRFRSNVDNLVHKMAGNLPTEERVTLIRGIVQEFDTYRAETETAMREALVGWRGLIAKLFGKLMTSLGIEAQNPDVFSLNQRIRHLTTAPEIEAWDEKLNSFLDPRSGIAPVDDSPARMRMADTSTANDNLTGLHGGGRALERLTQLIESADRGFVVLFRLGCLNLINERFGEEAVEDAVMAVSSYLTHSLRKEDAIYHWTDASLLAILDKRSNEHILNAELKRIVALNRDVNINIGGRTVMLRIPIEFDAVPIARLRSADDVRKLSLESSYTH